MPIQSILVAVDFDDASARRSRRRSDDRGALPRRVSAGAALGGVDIELRRTAIAVLHRTDPVRART